MITSQQYRERLKKLKPNVFVDGQLVGRDAPGMQGEINTLEKGYLSSKEVNMEEYYFHNY